MQRLDLNTPPASLVCGLSQSDGMLLVARGAQWLGGALVLPTARLDDMSRKLSLMIEET